MATEVGQPDEAEHLGCNSPTLGLGHAAHLETERHIIDHVEPGHERVLLKDDAPVRTGASDLNAIQKNPALRRHEEAGDRREERRLSAAGLTQRDDELAGPDRQIQPRQSRHLGTALSIMNAEVIDLEYATLLMQKSAPIGRWARLADRPAYFAALTYSSVTNLA